MDPEDWRPGISTKEVGAGARHLKSGEVVLLHDGLARPLSPEAGDRSATVRAVPQIIALARDRGLGLTALPAG